MGIKEVIGKKLPRALTIWRVVRISRGRFSFSGWGMYTDNSTNPPWENTTKDVEFNSAIGFNQANTTLKHLIDNRKFKLSQFAHLSEQSSVLEPLAWRHYIVYWGVLTAAKVTREGSKNLVEAGTCDGLTSYFAIMALKNLNLDYKLYMYDAWEGMKGDDLMESEKSKLGMYDYLSIETTIQNLIDFSQVTVFNKGYIPNSFLTSKDPDDLIWMHVDLNSAIPTQNSLEHFYDKMLPGGIFLFDDYGFNDHLETKKVVDTFFDFKKDNLLQMPTGQALVFKG
jgi:O-methyltransferase